MSFINKTNILIKKNNNDLYYFDLDKDIVFTKISNKTNTLISKKLFDGDYSFVDIWLDTNEKDNIYGVINDKKGKILNLTLEKDNVDTHTIIKYDYKNFIIKFPYTKHIEDIKHTIYCSINKSIPLLANLIHIYEDDNIFIKNTIDFIDFNILSNFVVAYSNNKPIIFYFKLVDNFEELFVSIFDLNSYSWSNPIQITKSNKNKIYLSVLQDENNNYHIAFSENHDNKYYCKYINISLENNVLKINQESIISKDVMCLFPSIIKKNSTLYIQWVEYFDLFICQSDDFGMNWSKPIIDKNISNKPFIRYQYISDNITSIFAPIKHLS
ncbi:hypothetical protein [Romboutsia ilealis]|uniref:hypothetical protein n=1 Tax=Romboutsia ilealis TaxID=1115758 RepID=UPI0025747660|nr:hypothetical protein [Romboutsia ilealis]